jgi:hypothetical protein
VPSSPRPRRRHSGRWVAAAVAVVLLALGGGYLLLTNNAPDRPGQAGHQATQQPTAATSGTRPTASSTAPATSAPATSAPATSTSAPSSHPPASRTAPSPHTSPRNPMQAGTMTRFVADYYNLLPENQAEGWRRLGPVLHRIGFDSYTRFWSSVRSVGTSNLTADPARRTVSGTVTFVMDDGQTSREFHSFTLVKNTAGTGLLINTDSAVNGLTTAPVSGS